MGAMVTSPAEQEEIAAFRHVEGILDACGPVGISRKAREALRGESGHASNLLAITYLGDILDALGGTEGIGPFSSDLGRVLETAIACMKKDPRIKEALVPRLPRFIEGLMNKTDCGGFAFGPAIAVLGSRDTDMIAAIKPHMPELFNRTTWSSHQWGRLACAWLDANGNPEFLLTSLDRLFSLERGTPQTVLVIGNTEYRPAPQNLLFAYDILNNGFLNFINHPRIHESSALKRRLAPIAATQETEEDPRPVLCGIFNKKAYILSKDQKSPFMIFPLEDKPSEYMPHLEKLGLREKALGLFKRIRNAANNGPVHDTAQAAMNALQVTAPGR